ncbi:MAG: response regulator transcription factor [Clostridiaceae bacterium]|nr:response regulator transcription factor [Clostridiaceae bacterium]
MSTILIIEDEKSIVDLISFNLKREGYNIIAAYDGQSGLEMSLSGKVDLVLLDVMLPVMDGFEVLRRIRQGSNLPVIMVTAREEEADKIFGLEKGADDYITKPFSVKELAARIKANMRRTGIIKPSEGESFGPFRVDKSLQSISRDGKMLELTQKEYDIICYFLSNPSRVISREEFMEKVWGYDYYGDLRAVDVAMRRLREKLEDDPAEPKYLMTKRGSGYYLQI